MTVHRLRRSLLAWYDRERRPLPWRESRDPYRVWVSEVMLQQTRVEAVIPHFHRFLDAFPTLADLAEASIDAVLARWSGLGYYRRARSLHGAARECRERYGGRVPRDPEAFGRLGGVGPYTRAAVLSIAYDEPLAVVDGNVIRVLARLDGLPGHARSSSLKRLVDARAGELLSRTRPGDFNQAVMELGAVVCTPRAPRCDVCPWRSECRALAAGEPTRWPAPAPRAVARKVRWSAALIERRGRVLLARRAESGRMQGMWELPYVVGDERGIGPGRGLDIELGAALGSVRHSILDERITLEVFEASLAAPKPRGTHFAWVAPAAIEGYGVSSIWKKALSLRP